MNRHRVSNKTVNNETTAALEGVTDIPRYFTSISDSTEIAKAQFKQLPIILYNPRHKITDQFKTFAAELEQWRSVAREQMAAEREKLVGELEALRVSAGRQAAAGELQIEVSPPSEHAQSPPLPAGARSLPLPALGLPSPSASPGSVTRSLTGTGPPLVE